jgi:hypothetical protein
MKKIDGMQDVVVSLNDSKASLTLKADNKVTLKQILSAIEKNGFNPREAKVRVRGQITKQPAGWVLHVTGSDDVLRIVEVAGDKAILDQVKQMTGKSVVVQGTLPPPEKAKLPQTILVQSIQ